MPGLPRPADIASPNGVAAGPLNDSLGQRAHNGAAGAEAAPEPSAAAPAPAPVASSPDTNAEVPAGSLARASWSLATISFAVAALILLLDGYLGYASVTFAVSVAAGINLL